jgi:AhpD family alkylhydroperoxidase
MQKRTRSPSDDRGELQFPASDSWQRFTERHPTLAAAYDALSEACREAGPLDERTVALVKLAISVGRHADRTVHSHAKKALRAGVEANELRHVARIALPTIGLPAALDALGWIDESIREAFDDLTESSPFSAAQTPGDQRRA